MPASGRSTSAAGPTIDTRATNAHLLKGTPIVAVCPITAGGFLYTLTDIAQQRALIDRSLRFPRLPNDPLRQTYLFNVAAGSFYLSRYGHPGVGLPL